MWTVLIVDVICEYAQYNEMPVAAILNYSKTTKKQFCWVISFGCYKFGCQYQCSWLSGKTGLWNGLLCVEWDVKLCSLTHSLFQNVKRQRGTKTGFEHKQPEIVL